MVPTVVKVLRRVTVSNSFSHAEVRDRVEELLELEVRTHSFTLPDTVSIYILLYAHVD